MPEDHSKVASPLAEQIASDGEWGTAKSNASDTFDVVIHVEGNRNDAARKHAKDVGAAVEATYGDMIWATVRADRIVELANGRGIRLVEERSDPMAHSTSEGVNTTNADQVHGLDLRGGGVTVAIIDLEFNPDQAEISDQVVAQIGDSSNFKPGTSGLHGTACAEIVSEMLPEADLVLASALGIAFPTLMDDITAQTDPAVMSMSLGYKPTIRLDGEDYLSDRITEYTSATGTNTAEGGVFAVSAGNAANGSHWDGPYLDSDGDNYLEFDGSGTELLRVDTYNSGQELVVQSDADWSTDQDYVLELYDSNISLIKSPAPTTTPAQSITLPGSSGTMTTSYLAIGDNGMSGSEHLDVFTWGNYVELPNNSTSARSLGIPATSPDRQTLSTGAVKHDTDELEAFSSRGPTQDGRRGVDIVGPDDTQSDTYSGEFPGTSAAAPHVAGAAGLLASFPAVENTDVVDALFATARDISDGSVPPPTNTQLGHGYVEARSALDELIGTNQQWTAATGGRSQYTTPAVDDQRVYVGGLDETLYALTRADGAQSWSKHRTGALADSSPRLAGGQIFVGSGGGVFYALDAATGSENWTASTGSAIGSSPAVLGSRVFVGTNDGHVHAWATGDGSDQWSTDVGAPVFSDVAAANGRVFVTTNGGDVVALDASDGSEEWRVSTGVELGASSPAVGNGRVFVAADQVSALAEADGSQAWSQGSFNGTAGSDAAYLAGTVFAGDADGVVWALSDSGDGSVIWSVDTGTAAIEATPTPLGRRLTVATADGTLVVFDSGTGTEYGRTTLPSQTRSTPAVDGSDVYVGTRTGSLVAF